MTALEPALPALALYPEINALLDDRLASVQVILGAHFAGMILFGSAVAGDFDEASDVDVLVVTDGDLSHELFNALQGLHERLAHDASPWAAQFEVSYIPLAALRRYDPAHNRHPRLDRGRGERLHWMAHDVDWIAQRHIIREHGLALAGPAPATLVDAVQADDLRGAMRPVLRLWAKAFLDDPAQLSRRGYQSFVVLSICRILYTLEFGAVVSKAAAARWALANWDPRWRRLIERASAGRHMPDTPALPEDFSETLELIRTTIPSGKVRRSE